MPPLPPAFTGLDSAQPAAADGDEVAGNGGGDDDDAAVLPCWPTYEGLAYASATSCLPRAAPDVPFPPGSLAGAAVPAL